MEIKNEIAASGHFPFAMIVHWDSANPVSICKRLEIKNEIAASGHFPFAVRDQYSSGNRTRTKELRTVSLFIKCLYLYKSVSFQNLYF
ncbi:MAG: hypothetical protein ACI83B_000664 [Sediminicola sp.]